MQVTLSKTENVIGVPSKAVLRTVLLKMSWSVAIRRVSPTVIAKTRGVTSLAEFRYPPKSGVHELPSMDPSP
jgi:hypothetical protein